MLAELYFALDSLLNRTVDYGKSEHTRLVKLFIETVKICFRRLNLVM